ncbi:MAG: ABC transporter ATP-binding protein [Pseudomonadota bacterium]
MSARARHTWIDRQRSGLIWRLASENAWEHRRAYAAALALMAVVAAMGGAIALTVEQVTDEVFFRQNAESLGWVAALVVAVFAVRGVAMYGQSVILARIGNRIVARLQSRLYAHTLRQSLLSETTPGNTGENSGESGGQSGDLATRMTHSAHAAREVLKLLATRLGVDLMTVLVLFGVMLYQDWRLTVVALIALPAVVGGVAILVARVRRLARAEVTLNARILSGVQETVAGARIIRAFGLEERMQTRMATAITGARTRADRIAVLQGLVNPLMETTAGIAAAGVILYGGWRVIHDGLAVGTFFSFLTALMMAGDPGRRLAQLSVALRRHAAGVAFLYDALDRDTALSEGTHSLAIRQGEVRLEGLGFHYPESTGGLDGLDLVAPAGQVTALVGPSGAGKSTVLALIARLFDPDTGRILIDGQDIRTASLASLRGQIALVSQETFLFDASVAENIALGRPGASRAEIEAAAEAAHAHDFVSALEQGYDTPLGEGGARLSGGQRQRLAIARALLRDAPILLLDEATAALDAEAEERVRAGFSRLMQGRTVIVVAHALATVRAAHQICVVEGGRIVECGTHDTLAKAGGLYARFAALQFAQGQAGQDPRRQTQETHA